MIFPPRVLLLAAIVLLSAASPSFATLKGRTNLPFDIPHYKERVKQFMIERHNKPIVVLGDSRVENADWKTLLGIADLSNRGVSGDTTTGTVQRLAISMPDTVKLCVIQLGINDVSGKIPNAQILQNYRTILGFLEQKRAEVLLTSVVLLGQDPKNESKNTQVRALNQSLQRLTNGTTVRWVDLNAKLAPTGVLEPSFTVDKVHFTPAGYAQIATVLQPLLPR